VKTLRETLGLASENEGKLRNGCEVFDDRFQGLNNIKASSSTPCSRL